MAAATVAASRALLDMEAFHDLGPFGSARLAGRGHRQVTVGTLAATGAEAVHQRVHPFDGRAVDELAAIALLRQLPAECSFLQVERCTA